jgi:hypothetical protein
MKKVNYIIGYYFYIFIFIVCFINLRCAGVIGNVERYEFNISKSMLDSVINELYIEFPELNIENYSSIYKNESEYKICVITQDKDKYAFRFCIENIGSDFSKSEVILTNAGKFGEILQLNSEIGFFKKQLLKSIFKNFIEKINTRVQKG